MPIAASPAARAVRTGLPGIFALTALTGMIITVVSLVSTPAVDIGPFRSEGHDALALFLGHGLYHDPSGSGYTGLLYTPFLPLLVAGLDELALWSGWPALVTVLATLGLGLSIATVAWRAAGERRPSTLVGAAGMGGLAVWLTTSAVGLLYLGWTDELGWAFALGGLLVGARARDVRSAVVCVLMFTLAFWSKQTTLAAALAYVLWLALLTLRGQRSPRFTLGLIGAMLAVNLVVLGGLALMTGGWEYFFNFTLPTRQARLYGARQFASDLAKVVSLPALCAAALSAVALGRDWRRRTRLDSTGALLAVFVLVGLPLAMYFRSKQGGNPNQYFGVIWALGTISALAWGKSRRAGGTLLVDCLIVAALLGAALATAGRLARFDLRLLRIDYRVSIPADLRSVAERGPLFHPAYTDLARGQIFPDVLNAADLLASGEQPMGLVRALLARRFRYAVGYRTALGAGGLSFFDAYASAYGTYEENYFWKLDQLIAAGYAAAPGLPVGVLQRRAGPDRAAALGACFGPFKLSNRRWTIRQGGGLWCPTSPGVITLGGAPAPHSELVTQTALLGSGTLRLTAHPGGEVLLVGGGGWLVDARRGSTGWVVGVRRPGSRRLQTARGSWLSLDLGGGQGLAVGPDPSAARISLLATPDRGVQIDTTGLRLRP